MMFDKVVNPLDQLELIDVLQRLGLGYRFEDQIKGTLESLYNNFNNGGEDLWNCDNLYATSLAFRLLRQHRYHVSSDWFNIFQDSMGNFKASIMKDIEGLLSLYEASYLSIEGETLLDEAKYFASKHLKEFFKNEEKDISLVKGVSHSLVIPLHWRIPKLEARWFMEVYERSSKVNPLLLELAKLDFNIVQATYQQDLKLASSWWRRIALGEKFTFARSRLMESFLWNIGLGSEPQFSYFRRMSTAIFQLITVEKYLNVIPYLKKVWVDLCKTYLKEAKWYHSGYKPRFEEYLENGLISVGGANVLIHNYFFGANPITMEALACFENDYPIIIRLPSLITGLVGDLADESFSTRIGDVSKSVECYVNEKGVSKGEAKAHVRSLVDQIWKKMNEDVLTNSPIPHGFKEIAVNLARMSLWIYQYADGHTDQDPVTKDIASLLIEPVP
ncbi:hypothetical protein L6164_008686 [Bauhinia variegata]|uniref:Uncharacterized protein n=1 Tax=Bauhinia variegata TaxID=167791 RepID=A0ACB9PKA5_BAUVA|nr:hypothetical protein L6164_008686 [Bauhinia variegata]